MPINGGEKKYWVFLHTKTSVHAHFKCKIFHHVDLPDYLMFAQDGHAEKCTRIPEARAEPLY